MVRLSKAQLLRSQVRFYSSSFSPVTSYLPTVYALSTRPGKAAIAVIRVTGSQCKSV